MRALALSLSPTRCVGRARQLQRQGGAGRRGVNQRTGRRRLRAGDTTRAGIVSTVRIVSILLSIILSILSKILSILSIISIILSIISTMLSIISIQLCIISIILSIMSTILSCS